MFLLVRTFLYCVYRSPSVQYTETNYVSVNAGVQTPPPGHYGVSRHHMLSFFSTEFPFIQKKRFNKQSASSPSVANHTYERAAEERDPTVSLASFLSLAKGFKAEYPESHVFILSLRRGHPWKACGNASSFVTRAKSFGFNDQNARLDLSKLTSEPASTVEELKNLAAGPVIPSFLVNDWNGVCSLGVEFDAVFGTSPVLFAVDFPVKTQTQRRLRLLQTVPPKKEFVIDMFQHELSAVLYIGVFISIFIVTGYCLMSITGPAIFQEKPITINKEY